jgi:hypothetical protein
MMQKLLLTVATTAGMAIASAPAFAGMGENTIGPSIAFGNGNSAFGVDGKFGVSDNLSIRPFIYFPSGGTTYGGALSYDFDLASRGRRGRGSTQITPYLGVGFLGVSDNGGGSSSSAYFTGGADFGVSDSIDLKAAVDIPFGNNNFNNNSIVTIGAGFKF